MSATFNEISTKLSSKNPIVIIRKNINISNYYYIEDDFDNLNSYSLYICKLSNFPKDFKSDKIVNFLIIVDINIKYDLFFLFLIVAVLIRRLFRKFLNQSSRLHRRLYGACTADTAAGTSHTFY